MSEDKNYRNPHPTVRKDTQLDSLSHAIKVDDEETRHRAARIELTQTTTMESAEPDALLPPHQQDKPAAKNAEFSDKLYMFPESFNALRRELEENFPHFFNSINPELGKSPAWCMVFDAPNFVGMCNGALDMVVQFDSRNVDGICKQFLNGFRKLRGVSPLSF